MHKIQAGYKVTPLSQWGKAPEPVPFKVDPTVDMKTPPKAQVEGMSVGAYFAYAAEVMKLQPPHLTDEPIIAQMKRIGIERGKDFDIDQLDPTVKKGLESAKEDALALIVIDFFGAGLIRDAVGKTQRAEAGLNRVGRGNAGRHGGRELERCQRLCDT